MLEVIGTALGIFALRVIGNMLTTLRLLMNSRGRAEVSFFIAIVESLIFAFALGIVVTNLDSILNLMAYSVGFATGGYLGLQVEKLFLPDFVEMTIISVEKGHQLAEAIREAGMGATETEAHGGKGDVTMVRSVIERHDLRKCMMIVHQIDDTAFVTTTHLRGTQRGFVNAQPGLSRWLYRS